ncbi:MAG: C1 family peptidase [Gemmatimonadota bacterium]
MEWPLHRSIVAMAVKKTTKRKAAKKKAAKKKSAPEHRAHISPEAFEKERKRARAVRRRAELRAATAADATSVDIGLGSSTDTGPPDFDPRSGGARLSGPVRDQPAGDRSCSAHAMVAAMEAWLCRQRGTNAGLLPLSPEHAFIVGKKQEGVGPYMTAVSKGILEQGCFVAPCAAPKEHTWRANARFFDDSSGVVDKMKKLLRDGNVLVAEIPFFTDLESFTSKGPDDVYVPAGAGNGGHAVCIVGYRGPSGGRPGCWIVKNSFGEAWGNGGYGLIRWLDPMLEPELLVHLIERVEPLA